jgi:type III restriction enzyme
MFTSTSRDTGTWRLLVRLKSGVYLILETKGFDELADVKSAAAQRWVTAVNADRQ